MNNFYENWKKERPILGLTAGVGGGGVGNFNQGSGGGASSNDPFTCTGGTINTAPVDGVQYKFHKFLNTGSATFTVQGPHGSPGLTNPPAGGYFEIFMVGGGGGGAVLGGGGGGGAVTMYRFPDGMKPGSYTVYVGDGANGYVGWKHSGASDGEPSYFQHTTSQPGPTGRIEAIGGGTGLSYSFSGAPSNPTLNQGVSMGGGRSYPAPASASFWTHQAPSPSVTVPLGGVSMPITRENNYSGYSGGAASPTCCPCRGGGGGGAGNSGTPSVLGYRGAGNGGPGRQFNFDGNNYFWAAGGGSDSYCNTTAEPDSPTHRCNGGQGGGGGGASDEAHPSSYCLGGTGGINNGSPAGTGSSSDRPGGNAGANTGSGGGAGCNGSGNSSYSGGKGGSGIIMIRYRV